MRANCLFPYDFIALERDRGEQIDYFHIQLHMIQRIIQENACCEGTDETKRNKGITNWQQQEQLKCLLTLHSHNI